MDIVFLKNNSNKPKYKQIADSVEKAIQKGSLNKGDLLPSLNEIRDKYKVSRDTVLTAFNELKHKGIIHSVVGKGYYVSTNHIHFSKKIFLLFDELNSFKEELYNSFLDSFEENAQVDIFFHHFNSKVFNKLIDDNIDNYSHFVIMPANLKDAAESIKKLPKSKVYILDQKIDDLNEYSSIYQDFENDIQKGLFTGLHAIRKYKNLILVLSDSKQPKGILNGFLSFCDKYNIEPLVVSSIKERKPKRGDLFITLDDKDLIKVIKIVKEEELTLAKDIGIISYNDTLLKQVVANGITTISTNFKFMGERLAEMILKDEKVVIKNPSKLIIRKSI